MEAYICRGKPDRVRDQREGGALEGANRCEAQSEWGRHQLQVPLRAQLRFFLAETDPRGRFNYDITGLLESAINAVGRVMTAPSRRGGHPSRWNHEDHWIEEIYGSKQLGQLRTGVEISLEVI